MTWAYQREKSSNAIEMLNEFQNVGLVAEISGRPKHIYSIHQKIQRYEKLGKNFDEIYDLLALRVIVEDVKACYSAVGVIHSLWHPLSDTFDDYIANPKPNGYQALHTAVMSMGTTPLEIQIRTREMHHMAEYGVAAHWRYKEGEKKDHQFEDRVAWLRQLIEWHRELSGAEEFLESVKTDILIDQVFVYTPKGEIKDLPRGATPLDFAYRLHTDLGHRCIGAKINGKLVGLSYKLKTAMSLKSSPLKARAAPRWTGLIPISDLLIPPTPRPRSGSGSTSVRKRKASSAANRYWIKNCAASALKRNGRCSRRYSTTITSMIFLPQ